MRRSFRRGHWFMVLGMNARMRPLTTRAMACEVNEHRKDTLQRKVAKQLHIVTDGDPLQRIFMGAMTVFERAMCGV
jgi:hypothetical protein